MPSPLVLTGTAARHRIGRSANDTHYARFADSWYITVFVGKAK